MTAIIMVGGRGTRLRPLMTSGQPQPMVPIGGILRMEHTVRPLNGHGFRGIVVTLQSMPEKIRDLFGGGSDRGAWTAHPVEVVPAGRVR